MKPYTSIIIILAGLSLDTRAATIVSDYVNPSEPADPFPYESKLIFDQIDSWTGEAEVGGWSYRNTASTANPNRGWGHASAWYLIELTADSDLTVTVTSSDPGAWAGFVLYSGESIIDTPGSLHNYSNNGNDLATLNGGWDQNSPPLSYLIHRHNTLSSSPSETTTIHLPAGLYTLAVGNAADSTEAPTAKTYTVDLLTVPEPSSLLLGAASLLLLGRRRR